MICRVIHHWVSLLVFSHLCHGNDKTGTYQRRSVKRHPCACTKVHEGCVAVAQCRLSILTGKTAEGGVEAAGLSLNSKRPDLTSTLCTEPTHLLFFFLMSVPLKTTTLLLMLETMSPRIQRPTRRPTNAKWHDEQPHIVLRLISSPWPLLPASAEQFSWFARRIHSAATLCFCEEWIVLSERIWRALWLSMSLFTRCGVWLISPALVYMRGTEGSELCWQSCCQMVSLQERWDYLWLEWNPWLSTKSTQSLKYSARALGFKSFSH